MTQTRIDSLSQELDKRNNEITHLLKNLKEAETALVRTATLRFIPNHFLFADDPASSPLYCCLISKLWSSQAAAVFEAKKKLTSINKAEDNAVTTEELIRFAHRISASYAVAAPPTWAPGMILS